MVPSSRTREQTDTDPLQVLPEHEEEWNRLPREGVEFHLETFQSCLDTILSSMLMGTLLKQELDGLQWFLPTLTILSFHVCHVLLAPDAHFPFDGAPTWPSLQGTVLGQYRHCSHLWHSMAAHCKK